MRMSFGCLLSLLLLVQGCQTTDSNPCYDCEPCPEGQDCSIDGTSLRFAVRSDAAGFFHTPWPADTRLTADGSMNLDGFPNPGPSSLLSSYLETIETETKGFGTNAAVYFSFDGPIGLTSLPTHASESLDAESTVFLVQLSDGPGQGERTPVEVRFLQAQRQCTPSNTVVIRPVLGFPLRPSTTYAAVMTRWARDLDGHRLGSPSDFERCKFPQVPSSERLKPWWDLLHPAFAQLKSLEDLDPGDVAALTVFTTQAVGEEMLAVRDALEALQPAPVAADWDHLGEKTNLDLFEAWFDLPEFQAGEPPDFAGGGGFVFDAEGLPQIQRWVRIPFTLAVPSGSPPAQGWPVVIYAHGTGGSRSGFAAGISSTAERLAGRGLASISIDQPLHGDRNPWGRDENIITFNPYNILAMRDNFRQGAADMIWLRRLLRQLEVPAEVAPGGQSLPLDGSRVAFMGHSQGSLNGPLFMAVSSDTAGAVFSGSGGGLGVALLEKTEPVDIRALLVEVLMLEDSEFDMDHPVINVFQAFAERADPLNAARSLLQEPPAGAVPKHLFFSQGLLDEYALPEQAAAMAAASGCWPAEPVVSIIAAFSLRERSPLPLPISGNSPGPDGEDYTAVMVQYPDDGHFAVFDNADARRQYLGFFEDLLHDRLPLVVE